LLEINIHKAFKSKSREKEIRCEAQFKKGQTTALYGKSGEGKTSVLRMIAGLETPDKGEIKLDEKIWFSASKKAPIEERSVGMVFQDFNLFKNMTIRQNLEYAANGKLPEQIENLLNELKFSSFLNNYPSELSGGQQQKAAIIRSICLENEVLLLDEPFSALDDDSILELISVIERLKEELNIVVVIVAHRKDVILRMAQSVVVMDKKSCVQGEPKELIKLSFKVDED
jgi:molybdate transport system ATP-binding protein